MKVVIAPDSFKGSLSAFEAVGAISAGIKRVYPEAYLRRKPVADGGEGTVATLGHGQPLVVTGPLGEEVVAHYASLSPRRAVVELAQEAGLTLIPVERRDPKRTTTRGVGQLLRHAARSGVSEIVVALGGSATNDGGAGILEEFGVRLTDASGNPLPPGGAALINLAYADFTDVLCFPDLRVTIACDVDNPLLGERGASAVFGPQKGATTDDVALLDAALTRYADVLTAATGYDVRDVSGAGAAGGAAAGLMWLFPQATLRPGIEIVLDAIGFDDAIRDADLVITGEGRLDAQTLGGKAVAGVVRRAKAVRPGLPVIAIVGSVSPAGHEQQLADALGLSGIYPLVIPGVTVDDAIRNASRHIADATERAMRDVSR